MRLPQHQIYQVPVDPTQRTLTPEELDRRWRALPLEPNGKRIQFQLDHAEIPPLFRSTTFPFLQSLWKELPEPAFTIGQQFAEAGTYEGKRGLLLLGSPGSGKTSLAVAILKHTALCIRGRRPVHFWKVAAGLNRIRESIGRGDDASAEAGPPENVLDLLANYLVVLDDLGTERVTEWAHDQLYTLIDGLLEQERRLVVTSNAAVEEWQVSDALRSRIMGICHIVPMEGRDWRTA